MAQNAGRLPVTPFADLEELLEAHRGTIGDQIEPRLHAHVRDELARSDATGVHEWEDRYDALLDATDCAMDAVFVARFLKRCRFDANATARAANQHLSWRLQRQLGARLARPLGQVDQRVLEILRDGPLYLAGDETARDTHGCPLLVLEFGGGRGRLPWSTAELQDAYVLLFEYLRRLLVILNAQRRGSDAPLLHQYTVVVDLQQFGVTPSTVELVTAFYELLHAHYPCLIGRVIVLNYRWVHASAWGLVKRLLSPASRNKITFLGADEVDAAVAAAIASPAADVAALVEAAGAGYDFSSETKLAASEALFELAHQQQRALPVCDIDGGRPPPPSRPPQVLAPSGKAEPPVQPLVRLAFFQRLLPHLVSRLAAMQLSVPFLPLTHIYRRARPICALLLLWWVGNLWFHGGRGLARLAEVSGYSKRVSTRA